MDEKEVKRIFCERLRQRRESLNITRKELSSSLKMSVAAISMYENGDRLPALPVLIQLAQALHTSIDDLVGYSADPLPEYERYKRYLESVGAKVWENNDGTIDVTGMYPSVKQNPIPLFFNKSDFIDFMRDIETTYAESAKSGKALATIRALASRTSSVKATKYIMDTLEKLARNDDTQSYEDSFKTLAGYLRDTLQRIKNEDSF